MSILITGATGFVGINATKELSKKYNVSVLVRDVTKAKHLFGNSVNIVEGNILDYRSVEQAMKNIRTVLHIAGLIKSHNKNNLYSINRVGSGNIALAAKNMGIQNVIYISSLAARGPDDKNSPVSHYGYSKLHGEYEFIRYLYNADLKILRPPIIYGPFEREFFRLFKMAKSGILPVLNNKLFSFLYVEDLVYAIEKLIDLKTNRPRIYHISDGEKHSWSEAADCIFKTINKKNGLKINLPLSSAHIIAYATYLLKDRAPFTIDKINEMKVSGWTCGYENLKKDINFTPRYSIEEGFEKTFRWYKDNGWI